MEQLGAGASGKLVADEDVVEERIHEAYPVAVSAARADALRLLRAAHAQNGVLTNLYMDRRVGPEAEFPAPHLI